MYVLKYFLVLGVSATINIVMLQVFKISILEYFLKQKTGELEEFVWQEILFLLGGVFIQKIREGHVFIVNNHGIYIHSGWENYLITPYRVIALPFYNSTLSYIPGTLFQELKRSGFDVFLAVIKSEAWNNELFFIFVKKVKHISSPQEEYKKSTEKIEGILSASQNIKITKERSEELQRHIIGKGQNYEIKEYYGELWKNDEIKEHALFMLPIRSILEKERKKSYFQLTHLDLERLTYQQIITIMKGEERKRKKIFTPCLFSQVIQQLKGDERKAKGKKEPASEMHYYGIQASDLNIRSLSIERYQVSDEQSIVLGTLFKGQEEKMDLVFPIQELVKNLEVIGSIGYGKTSFILSIARQLIARGVGVLIFDVKGEYSLTLEEQEEWLVYRINDLINPLRINIFQELSEHDTGFLVSLIEEVLFLNNKELSAPMKVILEKIILEVMTHVTHPNIYTFIAALQKRKRRYEKDGKESNKIMILEGIQNRLSFLFEEPVFNVFNTLKTTITLRDLFNGKGIVLDLSDFAKTGNNFTSMYLVITLLLKAVSREAARRGITTNARVAIIFEEALLTLPRAINESRMSSAEQLFILGRSLGLCNILIAQRWENISELIHGNALTKVFFRYQGETRGFQHLFEKHHLRELKHLGVGEFILINSEIGEIKVKTLEKIESLKIRKIKYETILKGEKDMISVYNSFNDFKLHLLG